MSRLSVAIAVVIVTALPTMAQTASTTVIGSTTTSTPDSGLLDVLVPIAGETDEDF